MIVDTHVHLISDDKTRYPLAEGAAGFATEVTNPIDDLIRLMDSAGVDGAVLTMFGGYGFDNSYHADGAARFPNRTVGVCMVDPIAPDGAEKLAYWVSERGMKGVRLAAAGQTEVDDPRAVPVWERAQALGVVVCFQGGGQLDRLQKMRGMAARYPGVNVALDHMSGWSGANAPRAEVTEGLLGLATLPNVYLKFSTTNLAPYDGLSDADKDAFRRILDAFTPRRMLWGTNYPASRVGGYGALIDLARRALPFLSESDRRWMLGDTAATVWPSLKG